MSVIDDLTEARRILETMPKPIKYVCTDAMTMTSGKQQMVIHEGDSETLVIYHASAYEVIRERFYAEVIRNSEPVRDLTAVTPEEAFAGAQGFAAGHRRYFYAREIEKLDASYTHYLNVRTEDKVREGRL